MARLALMLVATTAAICSAGCLVAGEDSYLEGQTTRFTFLHTSDIHSRLFPFHLAPSSDDRSLGLDQANEPFGGVARLGYLLKRERARGDRVLHIDSGDCYQGAPIFNNNSGEPEMRFLTLIGADAVVIGNHELDAGIDNLTEKLAAWAGYQNLAANYEFPDPHNPNYPNLGELSSPYALFNVKGIKVAVIGLANLGSLTSIGEGGNSTYITPLEQNETVRTYINMLHDSVDLVVIVSHLGLTEDEELISGYEKVVWADRIPAGWEVVESLGDGRVVAWVPGVRHIDLILGGHLHVVLNPPKVLTDRDGRQVILAHSGAFAKFLGRLDLVLEDDEDFGGKRLGAHKYQVFPVDERLAPYEDLEVNEMLQPYLLDMSRKLDLRRVIGFAPATITRFSKQGNGDSALGNLVAESMRRRRRINAELAVTNTIGIRDNLYAGPITLEDMFNVFPFESSLTVMYLATAELQELADFITSRSASRGCNAQAQVAGIAFTMNCGQVVQNDRAPDSFTHPAEDIRVNGVPLVANNTYKLATNDSIAKGGSGFEVLKRNTTKQNTGVALRDALIDYIATMDHCGTYELRGPRTCLEPDDFSQSVCQQIVDCEQYIAACLAGCGTDDHEADPRDNVPVPIGCGGKGQIPARGTCNAATDATGSSIPTEDRDCYGNPDIRGPYAHIPCVVSHEDGRLRRKTSDNLDSLDDPREEGPPP